jgi:hypothetical protein
VLISRSTARADVFAISTVPTESHGVATLTRMRCERAASSLVDWR